MSFQPKALWYNQTKGIKKWIAKISTQTYIQIRKKTIKDKVRTLFNPFEIKSNDSTIVNVNSNIRKAIIIIIKMWMYNSGLGSLWWCVGLRRHESKDSVCWATSMLCDLIIV